MQICRGRLPENSIPCELLGTSFSFGSWSSIQLLHNLWSSKEPPEALSFFLGVWRTQLSTDLYCRLNVAIVTWQRLGAIYLVSLFKCSLFAAVITFLSVALSFSSPLQQIRRSWRARLIVLHSGWGQTILPALTGCWQERMLLFIQIMPTLKLLH